MNLLENIKDRLEQLPSQNTPFRPLEKDAIRTFHEKGIPTSRNEEWKYTRVGNIFSKDYEISSGGGVAFTQADLKVLQLPGHDQVNTLVFVNGQYAPQLSSVKSAGLSVQSLDEAATGAFANIVSAQLGQSNKYAKDGLHALNTAFLSDGIFVHVSEGKIIDQPIYCYYITDARAANVLAQPRNLTYVGKNAQVQVAETYVTLGASESFTNQVTEIVVEENAVVELYRIQNDAPQTNQVATTHFRQLGKSVIHIVTISLNGGLVRNNLNIAMEAEYSEAHMYGLYYLKGHTHVDNHTLVAHARPNCMSNELYKGVVDERATGVFNGKILVEQIAQKTNAYQSNKNVLMSDTASVHTKPQLEIFADDVKCSHGCTVGRLDEEGLFYLRSRGIPEKMARALLVQAFAMDILEHVKPAALRTYVDKLIHERLEFDKA